MKKALIIVDVQQDFIEGGALAVTGGTKVASDITQYLLDFGSDYDQIVASRDWHNPLPDDNGGHFSENAWPVHCVAETHGAEYADELVLPSRTTHIVKGMGTPGYSAFEGILQGPAEVNYTLENLLLTAGIDQVDIAGLAIDYCVNATALDAIKKDFTVRLLIDLTAGVNASTTLHALGEMAHAGVSFTLTSNA